MKKVHAAVAALAVLMLSACAKPLPSDKLAYAGEWRAPGMALLITPEGNVSYARKEGTTSTTVNGPIKEFEGNDFSVGVGFISTKFVVPEPPHEVAGEWKMTVDGVELTRVRTGVSDGEEVET
jgi:hypothetical protein